jgi:hypothetical protein
LRTAKFSGRTWDRTRDLPRVKPLLAVSGRPASRMTVGEMKRQMLEGMSGVEDFAAQHNPRPAPPNSAFSKRLSKLLAR